jgi:hypothetical protein
MFGFLVCVDLRLRYFCGGNFLGSWAQQNHPGLDEDETEQWSTPRERRHSTSPLTSSKIMSNDNGSDDDDSSEGYEPEYEPEQLVVCKTAN